MKFLDIVSNSKSRLFNPDTNPVLHAAIKSTLYSQFCAGENAKEVQGCVSELRHMGYKGVMLAYAKEVVLSDEDAKSLSSSESCSQTDAINGEEISAWEKGTLATVDMADKDDFVALKFTGAGRQALHHLSHGIPCSKRLEEATTAICRLAELKGVRLLFDAEQVALQDGIDKWTLYFMKKYNRGSRAVVYSTYQAYRKSTPDTLASHLKIAQDSGFVLGIKLVRGAYIGSDPRSYIWDTIEDTHRCYDGIAEAVIRRQYNNVLRGEGAFPKADFVLATHNEESVQMAKRIRDEQAASGEPRIEMAYGQLLGMADHISCKLVQTSNENLEKRAAGAEVDVPRAYKYIVWGTVGECMKYLLRRATENRDAVSRTVDCRKAMGKELLARVGWSTS